MYKKISAPVEFLLGDASRVRRCAYLHIFPVPMVVVSFFTPWKIFYILSVFYMYHSIQGRKV